ncbi:PREDICTED: pentatricopeptide repeat-containing protein At5g09450, mitochondrial [Tarenaya hassleriana]|uniref:pentatricopeptide repeat-containing protein At5g09450, mitochondrial n=1 Tax=Tarenaya hassleriana TaxID=28532 RepID=UPI00053C11C4|nr:PREDICTED: pentatricopeptide repeat-containing protein At5g09450, mitochondrial [Tarenaya hassleriana]
MASQSTASMAARSLFRAFKCQFKNGAIGNCVRNSETSRFPKFYTADAAIGRARVEESVESGEKDDLKSKIFRLRLPKRSATTVLEKWAGAGNRITADELREISRELRRTNRYKHALEISEWMVQHEESEMSDKDYAVRIDLMSKVFGIDAAERYFQGLHPSAKSGETYTALLHAFAGSKQTERAEYLFEKIKEAENVAFTAITYNEMMTLYMSVGLVEKVPGVIEELKRKRVSPDIFTYNLWISSCAATLNFDEVGRILDEMRRGANSKDGWVRYINLANIYISSGRFANAVSSSPVEAEKGISQREWITYDFLIILHTGLGNKDMIDQIWQSLRRTNQKMTSRSYICVLSSYVMLGHLKEAGDVIDQWQQCKIAEFDTSACKRILAAFRDVGLEGKANDFHMLLVEKKCGLENEAA